MQTTKIQVLYQFHANFFYFVACYCIVYKIANVSIEYGPVSVEPCLGFDDIVSPCWTAQRAGGSLSGYGFLCISNVESDL